MTFDSRAGAIPALDQVDRCLLSELQSEGRATFAGLGRRVSLSAPAVAERVKRLETLGVIRGYRAVVDPAAVGRGVIAFIRVRVEGRGHDDFLAAARERSEILDCHEVSGEDCYLIRVAVPSVGGLEDIREFIEERAGMTTMLVFSSPIEGAPVEPVPSSVAP